MKTLIANATIVNEGRSYQGALLLDNDLIDAVLQDDMPHNVSYDKMIDAAGCLVMPGVIDSHVHFREPGLTHKADIMSESRAAAAGGVTSYFDMPNTNPPTVTLDALADKLARASRDSLVNYSFFLGATNDNASVLAQVAPNAIPGIKLFMGSSTGNMLVERDDALRAVFGQVRMPIVAHCESTDIINQNMSRMVNDHGDDPDVAFHPMIRSREACLQSTLKAIAMAREQGARLHVAHISTSDELDLIQPYHGTGPLPKVTAEVVITHLCFDSSDYAKKGALIKCNPAVKLDTDRDALRRGLVDGRILTVATDHAPHLIGEKQGGCRKAASGMPMVQFSLRYMMQLVSQGVLPVERVPLLMAHQPARLFGVRGRGFLRPGYKADVVLLRQSVPSPVTNAQVLSKCGWTPLDGMPLQWQVVQTICNGRTVYAGGIINESVRGEQILFDHDSD